MGNLLYHLRNSALDTIPPNSYLPEKRTAKHPAKMAMALQVRVHSYSSTLTAANCHQLSTFVTQYLASGTHTNPTKSTNALRMGILSTAMINPAALIHPAETHGGVVIHGVASRDLSSAESYAKKYSIPHAYGSYSALLSDPAIEAVYISLPNGMHCEWAVRALEAGKHVLLEKPVAANADEARVVFETARRCERVCVEAFHWRFHPAAHVVDAIVASGRYGEVRKTSARMTTPSGSLPMSDIRWNYELAGYVRSSSMECRETDG